MDEGMSQPWRREVACEQELIGLSLRPQDSAVFVNAGRGETIDQNALVEALQNSLKATDEPTGATGTLRILGASLECVQAPFSLPSDD